MTASKTSVIVPVRFKKDLWAKIQAAAEEDSRTAASLVRKAVLEFLNKKK